MKLKFAAANKHSVISMYIHTQKYLRTEFPPRANNSNCPFSLLAHVALTILVLCLCYQTQTHRINTTLCSLFSRGLLHALQPRVLYGWEAAQPVIMAFLSLVLPSYLCITAWWISATLRKCHRSDLKLMLCKGWKKNPKTWVTFARTAAGRCQTQQSSASNWFFFSSLQTLVYLS